MYKHIFFWLILIFVNKAAYTQYQPLDKTLVNLQKMAMALPYEKMHIQFDKPYYSAGDTIYFKAYVVNGPKNRLTELSNVLYVELLNDDKNYVASYLKIQLVNGLGNGDFALPDTLTAGNYRVCAYTNWMRNNGPEYFFDKNIVIANVNAVTDSISTQNITNNQSLTINTDNKKLSKPDIQFFPESGQLVNGIPSKIAFKAIAKNGLGIDAEGNVTDDNNNVITKFASSHLGMGAFLITPGQGRKYQVNVVYSNGEKDTLMLPVALEKGFVLSVDEHADPNNLIITIRGKGYEHSGAVNLIARAGGEIYLQGRGMPGVTNFRAMIPRDKLPPGIVQLTLFSATGEPLNERMVFIPDKDSIKLSVNTNSQKYATRQKVSVKINAINKYNIPVKGNFSMAVINRDKVPYSEETDNSIWSDLLLSSDIKGYIENPGYYFVNPNIKTQADLDILMLTQGYHRYEWEKVMRDTIYKANFKAERGLSFEGYVKLQNNMPAANAKIRLLSTANGLLALDTVTDKKGKFEFDLDYDDNTKFALKILRLHKGAEAHIELANKAPAYTAGKIKAGLYIPVSAVYLQNSRQKNEQNIKYHLGPHAVALKQVNIKAKVVSQKQRDINNAVKHSANLNGKGNADQIVTADQIEGRGCTRLMYCLQALLRGVIFDVTTGWPYLPSAFTTKNGAIVRLPMAIFIDGQVLDYHVDPDLDHYIMINEIASIEILSSGGNLSIYGTQASGGVMLITTKHGDNYSTKTEKDGTITVPPKGYYQPREFYSPKYTAIQNSLSNQLADLRTTIYWNPDIITDDKGNATVEYYNSDTKGNYQLLIEGIDANGNLCRQIFNYQVE